MCYCQQAAGIYRRYFSKGDTTMSPETFDFIVILSLFFIGLSVLCIVAELLTGSLRKIQIYRVRGRMAEYNQTVDRR
jgi:hypothetical protein